MKNLITSNCSQITLIQLLNQNNRTNTFFGCLEKFRKIEKYNLEKYKLYMKMLR